MECTQRMVGRYQTGLSNTGPLSKKWQASFLGCTMKILSFWHSFEANWWTEDQCQKCRTAHSKGGHCMLHAGSLSTHTDTWQLQNLHMPWAFVTIVRGGFRAGGGGLSSESGIFCDNVLEWYMNLYEPTDFRRRNAHKNIAFAKRIPAFPEIWGTQISKFSAPSLPISSICPWLCFATLGFTFIWHILHKFLYAGKPLTRNFIMVFLGSLTKLLGGKAQQSLSVDIDRSCYNCYHWYHHPPILILRHLHCTDCTVHNLRYCSLLRFTSRVKNGSLTAEKAPPCIGNTSGVELMMQRYEQPWIFNYCTTTIWCIPLFLSLVPSLSLLHTTRTPLQIGYCIWCNAMTFITQGDVTLVNLQRRFATHVFFARICRHVTLLNRFQKLPTRCSTANIAQNRSQRAVTLESFFAQHIIASWRCKLTSVTSPLVSEYQLKIRWGIKSK